MTEFIDLQIKLKGLRNPIIIRRLEKSSAIAFVGALVEINYEILNIHKKAEFINLIEEIKID